VTQEVLSAKKGRSVVALRLAACVNILDVPVRSIYRWKGKMEEAREILLLMKSRRARLAALQAQVERLHSYEVPEFLALPIVAGSEKYLAWLCECVKNPHPRKSKGEAPAPRSRQGF
jgi:periplasmic divalent cation tolerance protein